MKKYIHEKIDILARLAGLILIAIGIESITKMNWSLAAAFIGSGALISIYPFFIKIE